MRCKSKLSRKERHKLAKEGRVCEYVLPCGLCMLTNKQCVMLAKCENPCRSPSDATK